MYNNLLRPYRKVFLLIILLVSGAFFWFFGCHRQETKESQEKWKEEQSDAGDTYYQFENEYLKGTLATGTLSSEAGDHTTPVYLSLESVEKSFAGTFVITLPGEDGKGIAYQYAVSAVFGENTDYVFQIPNMSEASYYQVKLLNQYSDTYLSKIVILKESELSKSFEEDGNEYNKVYVGVLTNHTDDWAHFDFSEMEDDENTYIEQNVYYDANTFPVDRTRLQAYSAILIDGFDTSTLSIDQIKCLIEWVKLDGGQLYLGTGEEASSVLSGLSEFIGAKSGESELSTVTFKQDSIADESIALDVNNLEFTDSSLWNFSGYSDPEINYSRSLGKGSVVIYEISLVDHSLLQWTYCDQAMNQLCWQPLVSSLEDEDEISLWYIKNALYSFVTLQTPNTFFYGIFFVIYIFCLAFFGYQVLRRMQKREYIWICIPALSILALMVVLFHSRSGSVTAKDSLAVVKFIDRIQQKRTSYVIYQNKEGEEMSVSLSPFVKSVKPLDYDYVSEDQEHSSIKSINEDITINDTRSGYEVDFPKAVSGQTRLLQCDLTENTYLDSNQYYFNTDLKYDAGVCLGTITNDSQYNYDEVICIQGNRYQIIDGLDVGAQYTLKADTYKTWTEYDEENSSFFDSSDMVLSNMMGYVLEEYISGKTDGGKLFVIGLTTDHTYSILKEQSITNEITLIAEEKDVPETKNLTVSTDLNEYCQIYGKLDDSLEDGLLTQNTVEATYQLPEDKVVWLLTRDFTSYKGKIYAYNYEYRQNEEILPENGDTMNCGALESYVTVNNTIKLTFQSDVKEGYVKAPGLLLVLKDLE